MSAELANQIVNGVILGLSLVVLGTMLAKGALRERALALGPTRDLGLDNRIYVAGASLVGLYVLLMLVLGGIASLPIAFAIQIMPFAIIGLLIGRAMRAEAGLRKIGLIPRRPMRDLRWAALAIFVGYVLANGAGLITGFIATELGNPPSQIGHETLRQLQENPSTDYILTVILSAVVLAPLFEESVFRGVLQTSFLRLFRGRRWPALLLTSAIFSIVHWWAITSWHGLIPLFVLGLVFGYLYERTGSLLTPMLTHAGFNAINIAILLSLPPQ